MAAHRKWDDDTIARTLAMVVEDLGRMPSRTELAERDLGALWSAMRRHGGTRVWAQRVGELKRTSVLPPPPVEARIRERAYFLAIEGEPGGPDAHWLRAEREVCA